MPAAGQLGQVAERLGSLGGLAEQHFNAIGHSLEQAVGILAALTTSFQTFLGDLRGSELAQSGRDFEAVAARVGTLSDTAVADVATLRRLAETAAMIEGRIARMHTVLQEVDILAMNARLLAAGMGEAGIGFLPFAAEIRRSAGAARGSLNLLGRELVGARQHLQAAGQAAEAFVGQHAGTMRAITGRLAASVASIEAHVTRSGNAASVVGVRSERVRHQVGAAIVALQLGDIARQRIEHMQSACEILSREAAPPALACRMVAAQLLDVAEELDRGVACIVVQLRDLAADAGDIAREGNQAYGAADGGAGSFLGLLEADTRQAQALFGHLGVAHAVVNPQVAAVLQAAQGLVDHVATIRSVEADIHIMGLNTSLKCNRLGVVGRPLSVIAQAVRDCGKQTAQHAAAVLEALQQLLADTGTLAATGAASGARTIDIVAQRMTGAVAQLGGMAERMGAALIELSVDGEAAAQLLHAAVAGFAVQHEIVAVLHEAATVCNQQADLATDTVIPQAMFALIAADYTMARERTVHVRFSPLPGVSRDAASSPAMASAMADGEFADVLF